MKLKTLEDVLQKIREDMHKLGVPLNTILFKLLVWIDTDNECKPITGLINIYFNASLPEFRVLEVLRNITKVTPIARIHFEVKEKIINYHIANTENFMNKRCK
jgi:hypothetical protein